MIRQLLSQYEEEEMHGATSLPSVDAETGWYRPWYFTSLLTESILRAQTCGGQLRLIYVRLPLSPWPIASQLRLYLALRLNRMQHEAESFAAFGRLAEDDFVILVPGDSLVDEVRASALERTASHLGATTSTVAFPDQGSDCLSLLEAALNGLTPPPTHQRQEHSCRTIRRGRHT